MSREENKALTRRLFDEDLNEGDLLSRSRAADEFVAIDFVDHTNPPGLQHGLESHKQIVTMLHAAFADLHWQYEDPNIMRFADGKLVEHWGNNDDLGLLQQLGVVPAQEEMR